MVTAMRSRDRITHTEQAGRWISARMEQLGLTQKEIARRLDVAERTVWSAAGGRSAIQRGHRARWEALLRWTPGSITAAYETGREPTLLPGDVIGSSGDPITDLLGDLPQELHDELRQILTELDDLGIDPDERLRIAREWADAERRIARLREDQQRAERKIRQIERSQRLWLVQNATAAQQKRTAG